MQLLINGQAHTVADEPERVLLWVLRDELQLRGTRFSCTAGTCASCTLLIDGRPKRACQTPISALAGKHSQHHRGPHPPQPRGAAPAAHGLGRRRHAALPAL